MTDLSNIGEFPIYIVVAVLVAAFFLIRTFILPLFSRFDAAYAVSAYFIKYNKDLRGIIGPIVETKELPIFDDNISVDYRRYDIAVIGQHMSGILKCSLTTSNVGWNTKWQMETATFVPDTGEEIELKV